jgi:hypothetical protein
MASPPRASRALVGGIQPELAADLGSVAICFKDRGAEDIRDSGAKWVGGGTKRQRERARRGPCS